MSQVAISGNASGTGTLTIAAPNTNSNFTLTLPAATSTLVGTDATQMLTNKTIQGGAITSGTAVSASGTSVNFTGIPSWVKRITVMFSGVSTNATSLFLIQIGSGSVTTSGYSSGSIFSSTLATSTAGFLVDTSRAAASTISGNVVITLLGSNTYTSTGAVYLPSTYVATSAGVSPALSGALDRVRITTVNGTDTFDAGTINILYEG